MHLLILGGTRFVGRHLVERALAEGHEVTLFNRNRSAPNLFPQVEVIRGDRVQDVSGLKGRTWDAVIDTSAYTPATVRRSAEGLQDAAQHYTLISTVSVYRDFAQVQMDESAPLGRLDEAAVEVAEQAERSGQGVGPEAYGPLKARCEAVVEALFPGRSLIVRPGLIVGPHDYTDRFTYWVRRVGLAGRGWADAVLAPGRPERRVQVVDARDLAAWTVRAAVDRVTGTFNATGPADPLAMGTLLETCRETLRPNAELVWVADDFLLEQGLSAGALMPWHPVEAMPGWEGFYDLDVRKAVAQGLRFRPLAETIQDTWVWDQARGAAPLKAGLTAEREAALLRAWRQFQGT